MSEIKPIEESEMIRPLNDEHANELMEQLTLWEDESLESGVN